MVKGIHPFLLKKKRIKRKLLRETEFRVGEGMNMRKAAVFILGLAVAVGLTATAFADVISGGEAVAAAGVALLPWLLVAAIVAATVLLLRRRKK